MCHLLGLGAPTASVKPSQRMVRAWVPGPLGPFTSALTSPGPERWSDLPKPTTGRSQPRSPSHCPWRQWVGSLISSKLQGH